MSSFSSIDNLYSGQTMGACTFAGNTEEGWKGKFPVNRPGILSKPQGHGGWLMNSLARYKTLSQGSQGSVSLCVQDRPRAWGSGQSQGGNPWQLSGKDSIWWISLKKHIIVIKNSILFSSYLSFYALNDKYFCTQYTFDYWDCHMHYNYLKQRFKVE